jgi:DNA-directed RNA polymerase subunit RPC12/RpoP
MAEDYQKRLATNRRYYHRGAWRAPQGPKWVVCPHHNTHVLKTQATTQIRCPYCPNRNRFKVLPGMKRYQELYG